MEVAYQVALITLLCGMSFSQDCPISECTCSPKVAGKGRIIDCRNMHLRQIPYIKKSNEIFEELTFANDNDPLRGMCFDCNIFQDIKRDSFKNIKVKVIDFGNTMMSRVSRLAFAGQKKYLKRIVVSGDGKSRPPFQALKRLTKLRSLEIMHFNMGYIDDKSPVLMFPKLRHLRLSAVNLLYIRRASFVNKLPNLTKLEISGNRKLAVFPVGAIEPLKSIQELTYVDNGLKILPYLAFEGLEKLKVLDISDNEIWRLERDCFKYASDRIMRLDMKLNQLDEVSVRELTRTKWRKLKDLDLSSNKLREIPAGLFKNMPKLDALRIPFNSLKRLYPLSFKGLWNLKQLDLSDNSFEKIPPNAFSELQSLTQLHLVAATSNRYAGLSFTGAFNGLTSLEVLNLKLTRLKEDDLWKEIQNMTSLLYLGLGDTGLTHIPDNVFRNLGKLKSIDLSGNNIHGELTARQLNGLQESLEKLDLKFDNLTSISNEVFQQFSGLKVLLLYGNPLYCGCNLGGLHDWMIRTGLPKYITSAVCASPPGVTDQYVSDIKLPAQCLTRTGRSNMAAVGLYNDHGRNRKSQLLTELLRLFDKNHV